MGFTLNPEVGATLKMMMGDNPPPPPPVGDVDQRRKNLDMIFGALKEMMPKIPDVETKDFYAKAEDGQEILCRWFYKKDTPQPGSAICYAHGGGMICMDVPFYDPIIKAYVTRTGVPFMAVDYRLAPEHKAPTPVTDTYAGLKLLHEKAGELGIDPKRIGIMGDSAGGGITASLAHYIKQKGGPSVAKQILVYPMLDDRNTEPDPLIAPFLLWSTDDNKTGWGALLGDKIGSDDVPPIHAAGRATIEDLKGLPPAYIDVGELDLFRDEDLEYARKLGKAGVSVELHLMPDVPHAFEAFAPQSEVARRTAGNRDRFIKTI